LKLILTMVMAAFVSQAGAQDLIAPKGAPAQYTGPHRPHTKWSELKAKHEGQADWRELIVDDDRLHAEYIVARPGAKEPRSVHPDTRAWWVVMDGQIRFDIEGQPPIVASKGSIVQVPMQTLFSFETIGDKPSVRFEVNIAGARTLYTSDAHPPNITGFDWIPVKFTRKPGNYEMNNKPHTTFDEVAKQLEEGKLKGTIPLVYDDRGAANFIYGYEKNLPPINPKDKGHYHPESSEFWLIMAGQIRYPIEKVGLIIADVGDVVYVPKNTFHAPRWYGPGPSCRLAMNGFPNLAHLFEPK
jgi:mannose-6-phosphate isomerase-like protein (cupin superfamily)